MNIGHVIVAGCASAGIGAAGFAGWLSTLPPAPPVATAPAVSEAEASATVAALRPPKRKRPLIAIIGINDATETTDFLMPYGVLRQADVADVFTVATSQGPVQLYPAMRVLADTTADAFDNRHPEGADYVIVPAMSRDDDPIVMRWLKRQAARGAIVIGVCAGAKVVAAAGLLDGRDATTHWYYRPEMLGRHPAIRYVKDRRFVVDRGVATTTGVTASMPMALTLIEAIAGRARAEAVARDLGANTWDARHASKSFAINRRFAMTVMANKVAIWRHERLGLRLDPGVDEVGLALVTDAWSRTYRSEVTTYGSSDQPITTARGARVLPDKIATTWALKLPTPIGNRPATALDAALRDIRQRYGEAVAEVVAMQLEYPINTEAHHNVNRPSARLGPALAAGETGVRAPRQATR